MAAVEFKPGVWKSGRGKGRTTPKGRQLDDTALAEVRELLGDKSRSADLLIEHLHLIQDKFGHLSSAHLYACLLYTSPSPRDGLLSRMPSSA